MKMQGDHVMTKYHLWIDFHVCVLHFVQLLATAISLGKDGKGVGVIQDERLLSVWLSSLSVSVPFQSL